MTLIEKRKSGENQKTGEKGDAARCTARANYCAFVVPRSGKAFGAQCTAIPKFPSRRQNGKQNGYLSFALLSARSGRESSAKEDMSGTGNLVGTGDKRRREMEGDKASKGQAGD